VAKHASDLIKRIRTSQVFFVLFDESYLKSAEVYIQIELAKQMNKPFRVLVKKGIKIPDGVFRYGVFPLSRSNEKNQLDYSIFKG